MLIGLTYDLRSDYLAAGYSEEETAEFDCLATIDAIDLALVECGQVLALMKGRLHLSIEDIDAVAPAVLRHRIILNFDAHAEGQTAETILAKIIPSVAAAVPSRA